MLFVAAGVTDTKVRHSTGVATTNSTNKNPNANKLSWAINYRWGRLGDVPYRSALSLRNVTWWSRRWKGNVQSVPRSLCPVHSLAPPQALNPRNAVR